MFDYPLHPNSSVGPVRPREYVVDEQKQWSFVDPYYDQLSYPRMYMNDPNFYQSYVDNHVMIPMNGDFCTSCSCGAKRRYLNYNNRSAMRDCGSNQYYNDNILSMEKEAHMVGGSRNIKEKHQVDRSPDTSNSSCSGKSSPKQIIKDDLEIEEFWSEDKKRKSSFRYRSNEDEDDDDFLDKENLALKKLIKKRSPKSTWTKMTK
jgi:hypothetical protein